MIDPLAHVAPLWARLVTAFLIFLVMGIIDWRRHPENPRRAKEYLFLLSVTGLTVTYGIFHDWITSTISPEYFVLGKGISRTAPHWQLQVSWLAVKATYWVGLLVGATLLILNNPRPGRLQLNYPQLFKTTTVCLGAAILAAPIFGLIFYLNYKRMLGAEAAVLVHPDLFALVWGIHNGSYIGGLIGTIAAGFIVRQKRKKLAKSSGAQ